MNVKLYLFPGGQYWYDRHTRYWVTQATDSAGDQIGHARYDGNKLGRDCSIEEVRIRAKDGLLQQFGDTIHLPEADLIAKRNGYTCAERMVKALDPREKIKAVFSNRRPYSKKALRSAGKAWRSNILP